MKKLLLSFAILAIFNLTACKKTESENNSIIGKWQIESYMITNFENTGKDQDDTKDESPRPTLEFKEDGSLHAIFYFKDLLGNNQNTIDDVQVKYTVNGDKSSIGSKNGETYTENTTVIARRL